MTEDTAQASSTIENRTFDEIAVGDSACLQRRLTMQDIKLFAAMSGDINPAHVDEDYARSSQFHEVIAHGLWGGSQISTLLGTQLPGPGTIYIGQTLHFHRPVALGDMITAKVTVVEKDAKKHRLLLDCECSNQTGKVVISGQADVLAPTEKIRRPRWILPGVQLQERVHLHRLLKEASEGVAVKMAVVHPVDSESLLGAIAASEAGLIEPFLVGPENKIRAVAEEIQVDISAFSVINTPHSHAAAFKAVEMVSTGEAETLMKGSLHTDEFLLPVISVRSGLRTERRMSHVFVFDVPTYARPLFITDAALNIQPTLEQKRDIVQNAIDLALALGIQTPRVAILSAVETVSAKIPSTLDAAALCKMADRGQIQGGLVDGPLAFDNAVSPEAAKIKNIVSPVAGQADILVTPDLEAGNILAKQLEYLGGAESAGILLGARVPIVLTSRSDDTTTRMASCAIAKIVVRRQHKQLA